MRSTGRSPALFELRLSAPPAARCLVYVGVDVRARLVRDLVRTPLARTLVVISDSRVGPLHGRPLARDLARRGLDVHYLDFPAGERAKSGRTKERLENRLAALGVGRDTAILAVGGGVTGDLAGFVAATWHRGVPLIHVPTTLLSMVDSALGGKTAINLEAGKNLVGAFHHPCALYADIGFLDTLPDARFREGLAEVLKTAAIADASFFAWLEREAAAVGGRDRKAVEAVVRRCLELKARIVRSDPWDRGPRALLNFGHTVAHALERASGYRMPHGAAVARGLVVESRLAGDVTGFPEAHQERLMRLLERWKLPTRVPARFETRAIVRAAHSDKKARAGRIRCALPLALGKGPRGRDVTFEVSDARLVRALDALR